jgi:hypothetical protein
LTSRVVDAVWLIVPLVPVIVSDSAQGTVEVEVCMVSVEEPPVLIDAGLKPPLVIPVGKPDSLPTLKFTVPVKPLRGVTVTVYVVSPPGTTSCAAGPTVMEKSGLVGSTVIVRVGGLGSELPVASIVVSEIVYVPGTPNVTFPGFCAVDVAGVPPGNTQEYPEAAVPEPKLIALPAVIVTLPDASAGGFVVIVPLGGTAE